MGLIYSPRVVTNGLALYLDAADKNSYPESGTTWYDLSGNNFHHSLSGTPVYTGNSFTLNETNGFTYANVITASSLCTVVLFYKTADTQELWVRGNNSNAFYLAASYGNNYYSGNCGTPIYYVDTELQVNPSAFRNGNYHMWEAKNVDFSSWTSFRWFLYGGSWNLNGTVTSILIYSRSLTAKESEQNYNALKTRFGI